MMVELFLAQRFSSSLRKDVFTRFTTLMTTLSITVGYSAVCIALSILQGYSDTIVATATRFTSDVVVRSQISVDFDETSKLTSELLRMPQVRDVSVILEREALIKFQGQIDGVMLHGINSKRASLLSDVVTPRDVGLRSGFGLIIGCGVASRLGANNGDTVTLIMQQHSATVPAVRRIPIVATFQTGMGMQDDNVALLDIDSLRSFSAAHHSASSAILVTAQNTDSASSLAQQIHSRWSSSVFAATYKEVFQGIWGWIELQRKPIPIVLGLLSLVAVVSIVSSLLLMIVQKVKSIAILATLGMSASRIGLVVLVRAVVSAVIGVSSGFMLTTAFWYVQSTFALIKLESSLYYVSSLPVAFEPGLMMLVGMGIIGLTVAVALLPMLVARRIKPARTLRFS
jgi:lipoprotein-releasing system permease protein